MTSQATSQIAQTVARNVLQARKMSGLTQREVGAKLDMDGNGVSRWETGRNTPSRAKLTLLATLFDRDPGWFYTNHEERS